MHHTSAETAMQEIAPNQKMHRGEPPQFAFQPVRTPALAALEASASRPKLLTIVAPVGYGKTVFMASLHEQLVAQDEPCYWSTLVEHDRRVEDLLGRFEVQATRYSSELHPTQVLFRGDEPPEARVDSLIEAVRAYPGPLTIFVDNLHFCVDALLGPLLQRLIFETPASARFVISSTTDLPLNLARAKLDGWVRQIGYAELSLDLAGVAELLGPDVTSVLGAEQVEKVLAQTEGWPAAIRLMQIVMSNTPHAMELLRQFSGSDEDLVAMLNRQVLDGLPEPVRDFLLDIAPLHTFDTQLCEQASGSDQVGAHLAYLLRHNVFMVRLDRNHSRYRLHGLFREFLQGEAKRHLSSARRASVLTRAAQWCEQQGLWRDAIEYALSADAHSLAVRMLERCASSFVRNRGDTPQYIAWAQSLIAQGHQLGWEASYWYVWGLVLNQRYDEGLLQLERFSQRVASARALSQQPDTLHDIERRLGILHLATHVFTDRLPAGYDKAGQWLAQEQADDPFDIAVAWALRSLYCSSVYRFPEARETIHSARAAGAQANSEYARGWTLALTALPTIIEGQYRQAHAELDKGLESLLVSLGSGAGIVGTVMLLAANCAIEMGQDDKARALLDLGLRTAHSHGFIDAVACGLDAALKLWAGTTEESAAPARFKSIASHYPPRLGLMLSCYLIRRLLRLGRVQDAEMEAASIGMRTDPVTPHTAWPQAPRSRDIYLSTLIDLQIACGKGRIVMPLIDEQMQWAKSEGRAARQVDLLLAKVRLEIAENRYAQAIRELTRAIVLAAPRQMMRPFLDLGPTLAVLIEDTKPSAWGFAFPQEREFFAALCARMPISNPSTKDRLGSLISHSQLLDPLSPRQTELLALMEAGLSNQQIADRIDRTLTTVKSHLQALYAKLGVSNRTAALAKAKILNLL